MFEVLMCLENVFCLCKCHLLSPCVHDLSHCTSCPLCHHCSLFSCHVVPVVHCRSTDWTKRSASQIPALSAGCRLQLLAPISSQRDISHTPDTAVPGHCATSHFPLHTQLHPSVASDNTPRPTGLHRPTDG